MKGRVTNDGVFCSFLIVWLRLMFMVCNMMHLKAVFNFAYLVLCDINHFCPIVVLIFFCPHVLIDVLWKISYKVCTCKNLNLDLRRDPQTLISIMSLSYLMFGLLMCVCLYMHYDS